MRYVTIPEPITLTDQANPETGEAPVFRFEQFLRTLLNDEVFGKSMRSVRRSLSIEKLLDSALAEGQTILALEDEDWSVLKQAAESPSSGYRPALMRRLIPFVDAIEQASVEKPKLQIVEAEQATA